MRIVVTGAAGFIGSHVCDALLARGDEVVGLDCFTSFYPRTRKEQNLALARRAEKFSFVELDLRDGEIERALDGASAIIHAAAMPGLSWTNFDEYLSCNVLALQRLIDASRRVGVSRFVHASTSSVYGAEAVGDETLPLRPISPYGVTKLASEHLLRAYLESHAFPVVILRYFSIYGPRQRPDMAYERIIGNLRRGKTITIFGDGSQSRSNTFVSDCVTGTLAALDRGSIGQVYNVGGGVSLTLTEAIDIISAALGVTPDIAFEPRRVGDQLHTNADVSKARRDLGYEPATVPSQGLPLQVEWHLRTAISTETSEPDRTADGTREGSKLGPDAAQPPPDH
jgi:nucleoside-diphosphate-sugar epimerase